MTKIIVIFSVLVVLSGSPLAHAMAINADFYVAADGSDTSPGTYQEPFATLPRAQAAVRRLIRKGLEQDVTVLIRGGTYLLDAPLTFGPQDSGTGVYAVRYLGFPGESAVISGGRRITGFQPAGDNRWSVRLSEVKAGKWWFRQLFADGKRLPRARFPNPPALLTVKSVSDDVTQITFDEPLIGGELTDQDAELVVYQKWSISRAAIRRCSGATVTTAVPVGWIGHGEHTTTSPGKRAYLEHAPAFLDEPGEWYLDRATGVLTYVAAEGENPNQRKFVAPRIECLLAVRGDSGRPVRNLHFKGLTFAYAAWSFPAVGYLGIQAGHYGTSLQERVFVLPAAIEWSYADGNSLERCRVIHTGASGVGFGRGCRHNRVIGCELADVGGNGVMIGLRGEQEFVGKHGDGSLARDWQEPADVPVANEVSNCFIHHCGTVNHGCVAVYDGFCKESNVVHNRIADTPYTGISVGFRWDESPTSQGGCVVAYNHISNVMKMLADGGGIYTLGFQPGSVLRGNLIHAVRRSELAYGAPNNGIFFDQGSKGFSIEGNVIYDTSADPIRFNINTREMHTWNNNSFGVGPDDPQFPKAAAAKAGLLPEYRSLLEHALTCRKE